MSTRSSRGQRRNASEKPKRGEALVKRGTPRLPIWVTDAVTPVIADELQKQSLSAEIRIEVDRLYIDYQALGSGSGYVAPSVMLEFGARATGEPASFRAIACDAAGLVDESTFRRPTRG